MSALDWRRDFRDHRNHFVYTLRDADGCPVYVGLTINVRKRIVRHHQTISAPQPSPIPRATWLLDVRSVEVAGPYERLAGIAAEREQIGRLQPRANNQYTVHDRRPAIARLSAELAEAEAQR